MAARCSTGFCVLLLSAFACAISVAEAAGAEPAETRSPRSEVHERSLRLFALVEASNGYGGLIKTTGHRRVTLILQKGGTTVEARTAGRVTRHGIDARFGDLGEISVRFHGRPLNRAPDGQGNGTPRCRGRDPEFERGHLNGTIRFQGENGFTELDAKRAIAYVERRYRRVCKPRQVEASLGEVLERLFGLMPVTALRARDRVGRVSLLFEAAAIDFRPIFGPGSLAYVLTAKTVERGEGMRLTRSVSAEGGRRAFLFRRGRRAPRTATVTAPQPFTGSAEYLKRSGAPARWEGSLVAHLPGVGPVAMAGPGFKAATCQLTFAALLDGGCLPSSGEIRSRALSLLDRGLAQGSGSQSQVFWDDRLSWSR